MILHESTNIFLGKLPVKKIYATNNTLVWMKGLAPPENIVAGIGSGSGNVTISWDKNPDAASYVVYTDGDQGIEEIERTSAITVEFGIDSSRMGNDKTFYVTSIVNGVESRYGTVLLTFRPVENFEFDAYYDDDLWKIVGVWVPNTTVRTVYAQTSNVDGSGGVRGLEVPGTDNAVILPILGSLLPDIKVYATARPFIPADRNNQGLVEAFVTVVTNKSPENTAKAIVEMSADGVALSIKWADARWAFKYRIELYSNNFLVETIDDAYYTKFEYSLAAFLGKKAKVKVFSVSDKGSSSGTYSNELNVAGTLETPVMSQGTFVGCCRDTNDNLTGYANSYIRVITGPGTLYCKGTFAFANDHPKDFDTRYPDTSLNFTYEFSETQQELIIETKTCVMSGKSFECESASSRNYRVNLAVTAHNGNIISNKLTHAGAVTMGSCDCIGNRQGGGQE